MRQFSGRRSRSRDVKTDGRMHVGTGRVDIFTCDNDVVDVFCLCSAGVGRTGVFIALSIVLERMRYEGVVDLFQTVKMLRTQRQGMIQSEVHVGL